MRFATFNNDADLKTLTDRLFGLKGKGSQAATRQAAQDLLAANPELADLKNLPNGARIKVPDSAPSLLDGQEAPPPLEMNASELQRVTAYLDSMQASMSAAEDRMFSRLQASLDLLQSVKIPPEFSALTKQDTFRQLGEIPNPESDVKSMVQAAKDAISNLQTAKATREQNIAAIRGMLAPASQA